MAIVAHVTKLANYGAKHSGIELYGRRGGRPVIYLHGTPGAALEARLIEHTAREQDIELWAIDRNRIEPRYSSEAYLMVLADLIHAIGGGQCVPMLGFSIGAAVALRVASRLGNDTGPLFLLSAAGPLDLPGALDGMGGGARVFQLAKEHGAAFDILVRVQAMLARYASDMFKRLLFAGADAADQQFASTMEGRRLLRLILTSGFANRGAGYGRDLLTYVSDWSNELGHVRAKTEMWHGSADTWAPIAMAHAIAKQLPTPPSLHQSDTGHYTTLLAGARAALAAARVV